MDHHSSYRSDLLLAWLLRVGLLCGVLACLAMTACSVDLDRSSGGRLPPLALGPEIIQDGSGAGTRNDIPLNDGGCHEKSDSSLREPLKIN